MVQTQGLRDFSNDVSRLKIPKNKRDMRRLKRVSVQDFDRLHVMKYISTHSDVVSRGLLKAFIPCISPPGRSGGDALVLWLIFEEQNDFERFESAATQIVRDWWSELVVAAHALPTTEVRINTEACTRTCLGQHLHHLDALHVCISVLYMLDCLRSMLLSSHLREIPYITFCFVPQ